MSFSFVEVGHGRPVGGVPVSYDTVAHPKFWLRDGQDRVAG
ncbi:hypothetical protein [Massilia aurea]|nr:hypothetical protein [Massilia aurea]